MFCAFWTKVEQTVSLFSVGEQTNILFYLLCDHCAMCNSRGF